MAYLTMEADIDHGRIVPREPEKLPAVGKALLTVLTPTTATPMPPPEPPPDWGKVMDLLGKTQAAGVDGLAFEREARREWSRE